MTLGECDVAIFKTSYKKNKKYKAWEIGPHHVTSEQRGAYGREQVSDSDKLPRTQPWNGLAAMQGLFLNKCANSLERKGEAT